MTQGAAPTREEDGKRELILALTEATSKRLVDGLAEKFAEAQNRTTAEVHELKVVLLGSDLDKDVGVLPRLKSRVLRLEKGGMVMGLLLLGALVGNPKWLVEMVAKLLVVVR